MTKREVLQQIKLTKDQLTIAQLYEKDFVESLGSKGYLDFINHKLDRLKILLDLYKKMNDAEN